MSLPSSPPSSAPTPTTPPPLRPLLLTLLIACPLLALLPPRKLDLYTFSLTSAWLLSAEELAFGATRRQRKGSTGVMGVFGTAQMEAASDGDRVRREGDGAAEGGGVRGLVRKVWMGGERAGWQKRRLEEERVGLEGGKGYGDIIMEQVREVFPGFGGGRREEED